MIGPEKCVGVLICMLQEVGDAGQASPALPGYDRIEFRCETVLVAVRIEIEQNLEARESECVDR